MFNDLQRRLARWIDPIGQQALSHCQNRRQLLPLPDAHLMESGDHTSEHHGTTILPSAPATTSRPELTRTIDDQSVFDFPKWRLNKAQHQSAKCSDKIPAE
jgi:hypothetical protein